MSTTKSSSFRQQGNDSSRLLSSKSTHQLTKHGNLSQLDNGSTYGSFVAFIYMFNLVVGTGALALPSVLVSGGWILGTVFLLIVAFFGYIGVTFMIESMAAANALLYLERKPQTRSETPELAPLVDAESFITPFDIAKRTEMGQMAEMFFNQLGRMLFYFALVLYLYGDAAIYCTYIPTSLIEFVYGDNPPAWAFYLFLSIFIILIVPFSFFDFQKTKLLQVATMIIRNAALFTIIFLALRSISQKGANNKGIPNLKLSALPNLFGGAVYAFMCHHSLPGIITPMKDKLFIPFVIRGVFFSVFIIYMLLFLSCGFAFGLDSADPITFNFSPENYGWLGYALYLFPVFTLSSSFPMLSITLRNNLETLFVLLLNRGLKRIPTSEFDNSNGLDKYFADHAVLRRVMMTLVAVVPPILFCIIAKRQGIDVNSLVGMTGAFAGAAVMFIIPACLVYYSRIVVAKLLSNNPDVVFSPYESHPHNLYASPFHGRKWVFALITFAVLSIIFNLYEKLI